LKKLSIPQNIKFLFDTAYNDVRNLHRCKTQAQFLRYGELMEDAWADAGEQAMERTFTKMYIDNNDFNEWRYNSSGIPGCVADNQPLESHQGCQKGGPNWSGLLSVGTSMGVTLGEQLPKLTYRMTEQKTNFKQEDPILDYKRMTADGVLYDVFREFDFTKNRRVYRGGYICCSLDHLHLPITDDDIQLMEDAELGIFSGMYSQRHQLLERTQRFHLISEKKSANGQYKMWICDCYDYFKKKWCRVAALHQHMDRLMLDSCRIQGTKSAGRRKSQKLMDRELLNESKKQKRILSQCQEPNESGGWV
jgi:hypothetical protein